MLLEIVKKYCISFYHNDYQQNTPTTIVPGQIIRQFDKMESTGLRKILTLQKKDYGTELRNSRPGKLWKDNHF